VVLLTQRLPVDTVTPLHLRFKARSEVDTQMIVQVCRKHLLYAENCLSHTRQVKGGAGWQAFEGAWPETLGGPGLPPRLAMFSIGMPGVGPVDVDDLEVMDSHMRPLLRNGNFAQGGDFWFFGSDRYHLPWHAHNMFAHTYVEQGLFGLAALTLSLALAGWHLLRSARRGSTLAPILAAALAGASGALLAQTTGFASLDVFDFHRSADVMLILIVGGTGWLYGGIAGAIVFKLMYDVLASITPQYWTFWLGLFLVVLVLVGRDRLLRPWTWFGKRGRG